MPAPWGSLTTPGAVAQSCLTPGAAAPEAAAVTVPVLVAMGERDVCADVKGEPRAYRCGQLDQPLYLPAHEPHAQLGRHAQEFWKRIEAFAAWAAAVKESAATP